MYPALISKNKSYLERYIVNPVTSFTRNRKLGLEHTIGHILQMVLNRNQNGYDITSQNYFSDLRIHLNRELDGVARSSFCAARKKLDWRAFEFLLKESQIPTHQLGKAHRWKGHIVRAIDGTKFTLPNSKEILEHFPQRRSPQSGKDCHYPFGLMVTASNIFTGQPSCAEIYDYRGSEREGLLTMLNQFKSSDIALLDRGLDGMRVWLAIARLNQYFVSRLRVIQGEKSSSHFKYVHEFIKSGKKEAIIERITKDPDSQQWITFKMRLIRGRQLKDRSILVIGTNLFDQRKYSPKELLALYSKRWEIETLYARIKTLLQLQKFHARQVNGIYQEIFANLLILSLTAFAIFRSLQEYDLASKSKVPNFKNATEVLRRYLYLWIALELSKSQIKQIEKRIIYEVSRTVCRKQPFRSYPRYSRQPVNPWPYAKNNKIKLFEQGQRSNTSQQMREIYKKRDQRLKSA